MQTLTIKVNAKPQPEEMGAVAAKVNAYQQERGLDADLVRTALGIFIRDADGEIVGGLHGGYSGSWLFIDTVWLHERLRGQGYGARLMQTIEQHVAGAGVRQVALGTNTFQAPGFYRKLGYETLVVLENLISSNALYIMAKRGLTPRADCAPAFSVEAPPADEDIKRLNDHLNAYNQSKVGRFQPQPLLLTLNDANGEMVGGLLAGTVEKYCQIRYLWVDDGLAEQGEDVRLLTALHTLLLERGISGVVGIIPGEARCNSCKKAGYRVLSQLDNYPAGHTTYFMMHDILGGPTA